MSEKKQRAGAARLRHRVRRHPLSHLLLITLSVLILFPLVFTLFYSFFPKSEITAFLKLRDNYDVSQHMPILLSPKMATLRQYYTLLIEDPSYLQLFLNSALYSVTILLGQMLFVPMMAYALSRFKFRGREALYFMVLVLMVLPFQVTMTPNVIALRTMGLLGTIWAVILPMWFSPFYIFLLRQFMVSLPGELYEAGMIDGAGPWRAYWNVTLPVCKPVLGAAIALSFADNWNMVEQPLAYLQDRAMMPLSVMFNDLTDQRADIVFAGAALYILPMLFIYFYFQEDILEGLQLSELK